MYFFLSYARSDDDAYVARFYRDLSSEVRVRAGLPSAQEVGFFDTESIELGAPWSARLVTALSTCRSFVALCSPRYFVSEPCGREWQIFSDRHGLHQQLTGRPPTIIPVVWLPPRRMPPIVERLQYTTAALGEAYQREGLRQLMRLRRYHDAYVKCLTALAVQIVEIAGAGAESPETSEPVDFGSVVSAFHREQGAPGGQPHAERRADASRVHFVVAAPDRRKAATVRQDVSYYGETSMDWAPYRPSLPDSLVEFARRIAADRGFDSRAVAVDLFVRDQDQSHRPTEIVVLLIDGWATQLGDFRLALARLSEFLRGAEAPSSAAMVPSSHEDPETRASWWRLSDGLRSIFLDRITAGDAVTFRSSILTHRTFGEDLQVVLEVARNLIFMRGPVSGQPAEPSAARPILEGP